MARVRSQDTTPELVVRKLLHSMGYRFRLHRHDLPGKPDLVFPSRRKIIFVNGCFWHQHRCRRGRRIPSTNRNYWISKLDRNKKRDRTVRRQLRRLGWKVLIVWECHTKPQNLPRLKDNLRSFLDSG
ncbi:MAG: DNA mismatch endonuclease Vsr [Planctomycetes bacterium]|nr:DNA mismatch endonuclease Vsr [Planctomycetota bacterium]